MSRSYPERPLVGVGVVIRRGRDVLLVRRAKPPAQNKWSIPGGAQRLGETVAETAIREVLEETGVAVEITKLLGVEDFIDRDGRGEVRHHYTLVDFSAQWLHGEATAGDDAAEVAWASVDRLESFGLLAETEKMIRKAFPF